MNKKKIIVVILGTIVICVLLVVIYNLSSTVISHKHKKIEEEYIMSGLCYKYAIEIIKTDLHDRYPILKNYSADPSMKISNITNLSDREYKIEGSYYFYDYSDLMTSEQNLESVKHIEFFEITLTIKGPKFESIDLSLTYNPGYENVVLKIIK